MNELFISTLPFIAPEKVFPLFKEEKHFVWLDSSLKDTCRYSLMASDPFLVLKSKKRSISLTNQNGGETLFEGDPLAVLKELLGKYRLPRSRSFFSPGALGYFSYDMGKHLEKLPDLSMDDLNIPDMFLGFYDTVVLFDSREGTIQVVSSNLRGLQDNQFKNRCSALAKKLKNFRDSGAKEDRKNPPVEIGSISSNIRYDDYIAAVKKIKGYIARGDVYQINFARRIQARGAFPKDRLYMNLRSVNPTCFSGFFDAGEFQILSNSPELFLKKTGSRVITIPMKGTRPRGKTLQEDRRYREDLLLSEKDRAELIMIVDLERNDIGRVCRYGSVRAKKLWRAERYKTVFQTTAVIEGELTQGTGQIELLKAAFPGGSITGAPKIRAMEIIEELEPHKRAFYTGSMGYMGFNGNMELNILIRTLLLKDNCLYYPVGGGIVWDSVPEEEFEETQTKARALFLALGCQNENNFFA